MLTHSIVYEYEEQLKEFIEYKNIKKSSSVLLQVFTGILNESFIIRLVKIIKTYLPDITIIGCSSSGEIFNNTFLNKSTVLTFCIFEKTQIKTNILNSKGDSFELGYDLMNSFSKQDSSNTNLALCFCDGTKTNADELLNGIQSANKKILLAGGVASDESKYVETFVFNEEGISTNGAVMAVFCNKDLKVFTKYNFNWQAIGKKHIIEKSHKNRVFTIDGKTALDFYTYYLGKKVSDLLPKIGREFPLILQNNGLEVARIVHTKLEDGSLLFTGNVKEGSEVRLGYGNVQSILEQANENIHLLNNENIEALFVYSSFSRKTLLKNNIDVDIKPFEDLTSLHGCLLGGEFYSDENKKHFLNESMSILGISETNSKIVLNKSTKDLGIKDENIYDFYRVHGLSQLINQTTKELETLNSTLEKRVSIEVKKSLDKDAILETNATHAQMGEMIDMIVHQWRQPLNAFSTGISNLKFQNENGFLQTNTIDKACDTLFKNVTFLNNTIEDFRNYFKSSQNKELVKPSVLIAKTFILYTSLLNKHNIKMHENYVYNDYISVPIGKMMQVILNIVKNSIDQLVQANVLEGEINITTFKEGSFCILEIEDNAGGIDEKIIKKIFEKHFTTKNDKQGTGLGLHMSQNIVTLHLEGELTVRNSAKGAVFIIKIPLC